jgi:predicted GNAT family acetyltransferase
MTEAIRMEGPVRLARPPLTEVPQELAGRGVGSALAKAGLGYAREQGLQVIPKCEFVASYIEKHPGFADLLGSGS